MQATKFSIMVLCATASTIAALPTGSPNQAQADQSSSSNPNAYSGGWADLPGGVTARPYIKTLSITNGGTTTPNIVGGTTTPQTQMAGDLTGKAKPSCQACIRVIMTSTTRASRSIRPAHI
jgi:hypothetical protein